jgi:hypothetical protein
MSLFEVVQKLLELCDIGEDVQHCSS